MCFHNKNPEFEEVSWKIPLPLSINDSEIERRYNISWSDNNFKYSECKLNTKEIMTPNECEPEFRFCPKRIRIFKVYKKG